MAEKFPVSVKAVLINDGAVLLLKNERDEWELPGGKLEINESVESCLVREIMEETGLVATINRPLAPYIYKVLDITPVLIVPFECFVEDFSGIRLSGEHKEIGVHKLNSLDEINLPEGYRRTILSV
ncbi:hypothetical protein BK658_17200 [Pseudomonas brassicacearum]|uniref:Nudix hydrolase domain-containing protein n=2 Tax=Pseudomonas brassicacearum TaxID=930166 RepID=A0A423GPU6_9PSED|nr:hypothetical protein BK658_17200 [Pseudomonas brassicacearum]